MIGDYGKIWNHALRYYPEESTFGFEPFLRHAAASALGKEGQALDTFVNYHCARIWADFKKKNYHLNKTGGVPLFKVMDDSSRVVFWFCNGKSRANQVGIAARPWILSEIDSFTDTEYEYVASCAFSLDGAYSHVSRKKGDHNVDFYSTFRSPFQSSILVNIAPDARVVGQSKKYGGPVSVSEFREFAYTLSDVRHLSPGITQQIPFWFRNAKGPIIGMLLAHSGFQSGAMSKAKQEGIILIDSFRLAESLAIGGLLKGGTSVAQKANFFRSVVKEAAHA